MAEDELADGIYEDLITERIRQRVDDLVARRRARIAPVDAAEEPLLVGRHIGDVVAAALERLPAGSRVRTANRVLRLIAEESGEPAAAAHLAEGPSLLLDVRSAAPGSMHSVRPVLPLRRTDLLVNARAEPQLAHEVAAEMASADSIDLLCAFLRWSGLTLVRPALEEAIARGVPVRVLTTTYTGATDARAVDELVRLGAEVRISYEVLRTRLHAKAWLFRRPRGLDTAYVGSSNLSRWALTDGLEWNVRLPSRCASRRRTTRRPRCTGTTRSAPAGALGVAEHHLGLEPDGPALPPPPRSRRPHPALRPPSREG